MQDPRVSIVSREEILRTRLVTYEKSHSQNLELLARDIDLRVAGIFYKFRGDKFALGLLI